MENNVKINNIKVNKIHLKYGWKWSTDEETCLICQQDFASVCHKCTHPITCAPCIGGCGHTFHIHCVQEWLQNNKNCPMCRSIWEYKKIFRFDKNTGM